jgi:hypothetical protein
MNAISSESRPVVCAPEPLPQSVAQFAQDSPVSHARSPQTGPPLLLLLLDELLLLELLLLLLLDELLLLLDELLLLEDDAALLLDDEASPLLDDADELLDASPLLLLPLLEEVTPFPPLPLDV